MAINGLALSTNNFSAQLATKLNIAGGKVLQIVRATDATSRTTTSTSFVDVTGMSVTITPSKSTSAVLIISSFNLAITRDSTIGNGFVQITDASNNAISGAEGGENLFLRFTQSSPGTSSGIVFAQTLIAYATPATTSAVTYKLRFKGDGATVDVQNAKQTGQLYAIEVSA
jgi:hypothetical protein